MIWPGLDVMYVANGSHTKDKLHDEVGLVSYRMEKLLDLDICIWNL